MCAYWSERSRCLYPGYVRRGELLQMLQVFSSVTVLFGVIATAGLLRFSFFGCFLMKTQSGKVIFGAWNSQLELSRSPRQRLWLINVRCRCHTWLHHLHSHKQGSDFGDI